MLTVLPANILENITLFALYAQTHVIVSKFRDFSQQAVLQLIGHIAYSKKGYTHNAQYF